MYQNRTSEFKIGLIFFGPQPSRLSRRGLRRPRPDPRELPVDVLRLDWLGQVRVEAGRARRLTVGHAG
jgi:hypothetical protein